MRKSVNRLARMRKAIATVSVFLGTAAFVFFSQQMRIDAAFTNGMAATDVLGQLGEDLCTATPAGVLTKGGLNVSVNNGPNKYGFSQPYGVVIDSVNHRLFVSAYQNNRVLVYNLNVSNQLVDLVADNVLGQPNFTSGASGSSMSGMNNPGSLDFDPTGNRLFVTDENNNRVLVFDTASITNGEAAVNYLGDGTGVTAAGLSGPIGVTFDDTNDRLFVAQTSNRVSVFNLAAISDGEAAVNVLGQADFTSSAGATTAGGLDQPRGMAYDPTGNRLFVTDRNGNRVVVYDIAAITNGEVAVNVLGQANFTASVMATTSTGMSAPWSATFDDAGDRLFVNDGSNSRIMVYSVSAITNGEAAVNVLGQANFTSSGHTTSTTSTGQGALTYDAVNSMLYASDVASMRVSVFDVAAITNGEAVVNALGQYGDDLCSPTPSYTKSGRNNGASRWGFADPIGIALDPTDHRLFVAEQGNNRVLVFNLDTNNLLANRVADFVLGQPDFSSNATALTATGMDQPWTMAFDDAGNRLFVADMQNARILVFDVTAITNGEAAVNVLGQTDFTTDVFGTTSSSFTNNFGAPKGLAYDPTGNRLFATDYYANRVLVFDVAAITNGEAAVSVLGQADFTSSASGTTATTMSGPEDIAFDDTNDRVFVVEYDNSRVLVYNASDGITNGEAAVNVLGQADFVSALTGTTSTRFNSPSGLSYDEVGQQLFVHDAENNNRILVFDVAAITNGEAATNVLGQTNFTSSGSGNTASTMYIPFDSVYDTVSETLYTTDYSNNRVLLFEEVPTPPDPHLDADGVFGQVNESGVAVFDREGRNNYPSRFGTSGTEHGMLADTVNHRLYVADSDANRVLVFNLDVNNVLVDAVPDNILGQPNFSSGTSGLTSSTFFDLEGFALDQDDNLLFVGDRGNHRVLVFDVTAITNGEAAINVLGQADFVSGTSSTSSTRMASPSNLAYDQTGERLFVVEGDNNRVTVFNISDGITNGEAAINVLGQADFVSSATGTSDVTMSGPQDTDYDEDDDLLYVVDGGNNRVLAYAAGAITNGEAAVSVLGQVDFISSGAADTAIGLSGPIGLSLDGIGDRLFVAEQGGNRTKVFSVAAITDGEAAVNILGQPDFVSLTEDGGLDKQRQPRAIEYDALADVVYVNDQGNARFISYDVSAITNGEAATFAFGPATAWGLDLPLYSAVDTAHDRLFVSEDNNRRVVVYELNPDGSPVDAEADFVLGQPVFGSKVERAIPDATTTDYVNGIAYDSVNDRLFVSDTGHKRVLVFDTTTIVNGEAAINVLGQEDFVSVGASLDADGVNVPRGLAYDATGERLFVTDTSYNRVTIFDLSDGITNGEDAAWVLGRPDFTTSGAVLSASGLRSPFNVSYDDENDRLFVADGDHARALVYDLSDGITNGEAAVNVLGQTDFTSEIAETDASSFADFQMFGITYMPGIEYLYVGDSNNNRGLIFDLSGGVTNGMAATYVLGQPDFITSASNPASIATFSGAGASYDEVNGVLYGVDTIAHRVLTFQFTPPVTPPSGGGGGSPPDTAPPVISSNAASSVTENSATIAWQTNEATNSLLRYGPTSAYGSTIADAAFVTLHAEPVSGLVAGTTYHFQVCSTDSANNQACSVDQTFTTVAPPDTTAPGPVTVFSAVWDGTRVNLSWNAPVDVDLAGTLIRRDSTAAPSTPEAGTLVYRSSGTFTVDAAVTPGTTYHYSAFAYDEVPNYSTRVSTTIAIPGPVPPEPQPPTEPPVVEPTPEPVPPTTPPQEPVPPVVPAPPTPTPQPVVPPQPVQPQPGEPESPAPGENEPGSSQGGQEPTEGSASICGNGICEAAETAESCPADCGQAGSVGAPVVTGTPGETLPSTSGQQRAGLLDQDSFRFFGGTSDVPLTLSSSGLTLFPAMRAKIYLPDASIKKVISSIAFTLGGRTYQMQPTGSFTGYFTAPSGVGTHPMQVAATYADGTYDSVAFSVNAVGFGEVRENLPGGAEQPVGNARVTLLDASGAVWNGAPYGQVNPQTASADGTYSFVVPSGAYQLRAEQEGYLSFTTMAFPASNVINRSMRLIKLPPKIESLADIPENVAFVASVVAQRTEDFVDNEYVERNAETVAAPATFIISAGTIAVGASTTATPYLLYLYSFLAHPTLLVARRRRQKWGTVYDAMTKLPVDLAIVRLTDAATGRIIRSAVTDKLGRYFFIVTPGEYKLTAVKAGFVFPSKYLAGAKEDAKYIDLTHGETVVVTREPSIAMNIPMDPIANEKTPDRVVFEGFARRAQQNVGLLSVGAMAAAAIIKPSGLMLVLLVANALLYAMFRRLAIPRKPKSWGIIRDAETEKPLVSAVARIFETKYNKLLETQVTDSRGRYAFLVGRNTYYVTFEKPGYEKSDSGALDLTRSQKDGGETVALDVELKPKASGTSDAAPKPPQMPPSLPPQVVKPPSPPPVSPIAPVSVPLAAQPPAPSVTPPTASAPVEPKITVMPQIQPPASPAAQAQPKPQEPPTTPSVG